MKTFGEVVVTITIMHHWAAGGQIHVVLLGPGGPTLTSYALDDLLGAPQR